MDFETRDTPYSQVSDSPGSFQARYVNFSDRSPRLLGSRSLFLRVWRMIVLFLPGRRWIQKMKRSQGLYISVDSRFQACLKKIPCNYVIHRILFGKQKFSRGKLYFRIRLVKRDVRCKFENGLQSKLFENTTTAVSIYDSFRPSCEIFNKKHSSRSGARRASFKTEDNLRAIAE